MSDSSDDEEWPVSAEWLSHVLSQYHGGSDVIVTDYILSQAESALSDILSIKVTYECPPAQQSTTISLVLKLLPRDPFSRFFVTEAQFDLREIKFYTKVNFNKYLNNIQNYFFVIKILNLIYLSKILTRL
ncbi:hypothetical protein O3M35_009503 [Rhynocoris fuscipes]|uniref:Uncharacterized protein n=1 Tax=Rhynocoris fuscipes TaxID=488301 RepID=A0AAW1D5G2_9HEMI